MQVPEFAKNVAWQTDWTKPAKISRVNDVLQPSYAFEMNIESYSQMRNQGKPMSSSLTATFF